MQFHSLPVHGARLIELEMRGDDRGFFARVFCESEFRDQGLVSQFLQVNNSLSKKKGTLRGLHYQTAPHSEVKVVRCVRGSVWDAILDLRPQSPTYMKWYGVELSEYNRLSLYVPRGFAHAILTLTDDAEVLYMVSDAYSPEHERGIRWNDPAFDIDWPIAPEELSVKDANWPDFDAQFHGVETFRTLG